jgi:vacuolar-type H+-ATPase subunit C/Vma6
MKTLAIGADFNFLCGIFRSREKNLCERHDLDALLACRRFPDAVARLPDTVLGSALRVETWTSFALSGGIEAVETGYRAELSEIKDLLSRFSPRADFNRLIFLHWDFHNLKAALLRAFSRADRTGSKRLPDAELFGIEGEIDVKNLVGMADAMDFKGLPPHLHRALQEAWIAYYERGKDPQAFELALDRQAFIALEKMARTLSTAIADHIGMLSDISVSDVFFRSYFARLPWDKVFWGIHGHADSSKLRMLYRLDPADWGGYASSFSQTLSKLVLHVNTSRDAAVEINLARRECLRLMREWSYKPPSIEYAFYFLTRKLSDINNLRLILLCALRGVPEAETRGRVNDAFV